MTTTLEKAAQIDAAARTAHGWCDVLGFESLYQVAARPERVRSVDRYVAQGSRWGHPIMKLHRGRELKPYVCDNGRLRVILHADGDRHCRYVDDLVREAFGAATDVTQEAS